MPSKASSSDEAAAVIEANKSAVQTLAALFGPERWAKIIQRCATKGMGAAEIETLAGKLIATRQARHPHNTAAALQDAALGFLCAAGFVPTAADEQALEAALKPL